MSKEIAELVRDCSICEQFKRNNQKEPLVQNASPDYPWQRISMDLFEFAGRDYLAIIDANSGFVCSEKLNSKTSSHIIGVLNGIFGRYGYPTEIRADNSPFGSREFEQFANATNVVIVFSSPRYPQSNGLAEKAVAIAKNILKRCYEDDAMDEFAYRILEYNATPIASMSMSPSHLFFGRQIRTKLPSPEAILFRRTIEESTVQEKIGRRKERQKHYYDRGAKKIPLLEVGKRVNFKKNSKEWHYGRIVRHVNDRSYIVVDDYDNHYRRNRRFIAKAFADGIDTSEMLSEEFMSADPTNKSLPVPIAPPVAVQSSTDCGTPTASEFSNTGSRRQSTSGESSASGPIDEPSQSSYYDASSNVYSSSENESPTMDDPPAAPPVAGPYRTRSGRTIRPPQRYGFD